MAINQSLDDLLWISRAYLRVNSICESNHFCQEAYQNLLDFRIATARGFLQFLYKNRYA